jgi:glycosyltransferase involved in cell wall biosynthesis
MLFSIIVPTYNRANLIIETLKTLIDQSFNDFEIIVVDDGSTDNTMEIIKPLLSDKLFYHKINNSERGFARNFGTKLARGIYVNFFDSDDLAMPHHLSEAADIISKYHNPEIFHLNYVVLNKITGKMKSSVWTKKTVNESLFFGNCLSCNGVFIKKEMALSFPFNESRLLSASEDWDLWLRLSARYKIHTSDRITSYIVDHEERSVLQFNETKMADRKHVLLESLSNDPVFYSQFKHKMYLIEAHMDSYISLHAALVGNKTKSKEYFIKSIRLKPSEIFTLRFIAILKRIIF